MHRYFVLFQSVAILAGLAMLGQPGFGAEIVPGTLDAELTTGSLAGTSFPVLFSYDASQIDPSGMSYISLSSFSFSLLGTAFTAADIDQGGQVEFVDGVAINLTAAIEGAPPGAAVGDIAFGFGGPGIIGYSDTTGAFGEGTFTFAATGVPEPGTGLLVAAAAGALLFYRFLYRFFDREPRRKCCMR